MGSEKFVEAQRMARFRSVFEMSPIGTLGQLLIP